MASSKKKVAAAAEDKEIAFVDANGVKHEIRQFQAPFTVLTRCGTRIVGPFDREVKSTCPNCE